MIRVAPSRRSLAILILVLSLAPSFARAGDAIVLESYTGARPPTASELLSPILGELAARGFVTGEDIGRTFEARVSRPPAPSEGLASNVGEPMGEQIERGHRAWVSGQFDEAVAVLKPLLHASIAEAGALARAPSVRDQLPKALIALALSQHRLGDPAAARQTFGELLRSFPEAQVARATYGPDANKLFEQIKKELGAGPRGRLVVKLADEHAEVYINGRLVRRGSTITELPPGEYRVLAQRGGVQSRAHRVVVQPNVDTAIAIDLAFDAAVRTAPWTGFEFATATDRAKTETAYASALANALDGRAVVVVGIDQVRGRPAIVGSVVELMNGRVTRRASIALSPAPSRDQLAALARFLAGEPPSSLIDVELGGDDGVERPAASAHGRWGGWTWLAGLGAVAGLGAGTVMLFLDGSCPGSQSGPNCPDVYNTATPGWLGLGAGALLAGVTIYLIVDRPSSPPRRAAYVIGTDRGAVAGVTMRF